MATQSILRNVTIDSKAAAKNLLTALVQAENKKSKKVELSRTFEEVKGKDVKKLFEKN